MKKTDKVFLGGTTNETTWRDDVIKELQEHNVDYFDPVVDDWDETSQANEINEKENLCNIHLYVITSAMLGVYSIAEIVESAFNNDVTTIAQVIPEGFNENQLYSLKAVLDLANRHGAITCINQEPAYLIKQFITRSNNNI